MEGTEGEAKDGARKLQVAIHCAKGAFLLSSLKSSVNRVFESVNNNESEEKENTRREIENLRVELVKERLKIKKVKLYGLVELILQVLLVVLLSSFFMKLALDTFLFDDECPVCNY